MQTVKNGGQCPPYMVDSIMHLNKFAIFRLVLLMVMSGGCSPDPAERAAGETPIIEVRKTMDSVFLLIDYAADHADTLGTIISHADSLNVLELLMTLTSGDSIAVETRRYAIGTMVEQIGNRANGEGGYWLYTVNNQAIPLAASDCLVSPGDTIRFFFAAR